jgi:hypothetical protein
MTTRHYLEEDLSLIQKYFPGARQVPLQTPFDLTPRGPRRGLLADPFQATSTPDYGWSREALWLR